MIINFDMHQTSCVLKCQVMYYLPPRLATRECSVRKGLTRTYIWNCIKGHNIEEIGAYQPEDDGYKVFSIHRGTYNYICT